MGGAPLDPVDHACLKPQFYVCAVVSAEAVSPQPCSPWNPFLPRHHSRPLASFCSWYGLRPALMINGRVAVVESR